MSLERLAAVAGVVGCVAFGATVGAAWLVCAVVELLRGGRD